VHLKSVPIRGVAFDRSGLLRRDYFIKIGRKSNIIISDIDRSSSALKTEKWIHIIAIHSPPSTVNVVS